MNEQLDETMNNEANVVKIYACANEIKDYNERA